MQIEQKPFLENLTNESKTGNGYTQIETTGKSVKEFTEPQDNREKAKTFSSDCSYPPFPYVKPVYRGLFSRPISQIPDWYWGQSSDKTTNNPDHVQEKILLAQEFLSNSNNISLDPSDRVGRYERIRLNVNPSELGKKEMEICIYKDEMRIFHWVDPDSPPKLTIIKAIDKNQQEDPEFTKLLKAVEKIIPAEDKLSPAQKRVSQAFFKNI